MNENVHGETPPAVSEVHTEETEQGTTQVVVSVPSPDIDDNETIAAISERIGEIETRLAAGLKDNKEWTTSTLTSLQTEVQELKTNLAQMAEGLPQQVAGLRDELTRLSREIQALASPRQSAPPVQPQTEVVTPPEIPPQENAEGIQEIAPVTAASPGAPEKSQTAAQRRKYRVV
ncbi:MAG: hypothetical protein KGJ13_05445 [Patescibacteria group bacterium]|nr:hypothetical protein [Patescibacteria group bacterium]